MKLADLLGTLENEELERLAHEHVRSDDHLSRPAMLNVIEGVLRSYRFIQDFLGNRQPPSFSILLLLLDAPECALPTAGFRDAVMSHTQQLAESVSTGEIVGRGDQLRLYRCVLREARRNDLVLDSSESAILGVLRRELGIAQVEHYLVEHHRDFHEFWKKDHAFIHEINALRSGGIVFARDGMTMLAEDTAALVRQVLGMEMPRPNARRLFSRLTGQDLYEALARIDAKTSGSKDERVERVLQHMVQPSTVLRQLDLGTLKDLCRDANANVSGSKDEVIDRLVRQFATGADQRAEEAPPPPISEPRALDEGRFTRLFENLRGAVLGDILCGFPELRQSGSKEVRVATLWAAQRSEETLLGMLTNRDLEGVLVRLGLKTSGSKGERIARIVDHFRSVMIDPPIDEDPGHADHSAAERSDEDAPSSSAQHDSSE
jgi:hypothetical protein